jgi:hypothetical protein
MGDPLWWGEGLPRRRLRGGGLRNGLNGIAKDNRYLGPHDVLYKSSRRAVAQRMTSLQEYRLYPRRVLIALSIPI